MTRHEINTERLRLEPTNPEHAAIVYDKLSDERLWTYFPKLRPKSLAELQALYLRWKRGNPDPEIDEFWENWVCFLAGTQTPVGGMQATIRSNGTANMAYVVYADYQRRGYAREAGLAVISHLRAGHGVHRVVVEMDVRNQSSAALAESMGFARTGIIDGDYAYELKLE